MSLESFHEDKLAKFKDNKKLQAKLEKEWLQQFPCNVLITSVLSSLKENLNGQCYNRRGIKFPHLQHFDLLYYHAALSLQKLHKKEQAIRDTKLALMKSRKLAAFPDYEDESDNKISRAFYTNKDFMSRQVYDKVFMNQQANLNLKKSLMSRSPAFVSIDPSRLNSPHFRRKSPLTLLSRPASDLDFGSVSIRRQSELRPANMMDDAEIIRDIGDFDCLGFQTTARKLSASSSFSSSKDVDDGRAPTNG